VEQKHSRCTGWPNPSPNLNKCCAAQFDPSNTMLHQNNWMVWKLNQARIVKLPTTWMLSEWLCIALSIIVPSQTAFFASLNKRRKCVAKATGEHWFEQNTIPFEMRFLLIIIILAWKESKVKKHDQMNTHVLVHDKQSPLKFVMLSFQCDHWLSLNMTFQGHDENAKRAKMQFELNRNHFDRFQIENKSMAWTNNVVAFNIFKTKRNVSIWKLDFISTSCETRKDKWPSCLQSELQDSLFTLSLFLIGHNHRICVIGSSNQMSAMQFVWKVQNAIVNVFQTLFHPLEIASQFLFGVASHWSCFVQSTSSIDLMNVPIFFNFVISLSRLHFWTSNQNEISSEAVFSSQKMSRKTAKSNWFVAKCWNCFWG